MSDTSLTVKTSAATSGGDVSAAVAPMAQCAAPGGQMIKAAQRCLSGHDLQSAGHRFHLAFATSGHVEAQLGAKARGARMIPQVVVREGDTRRTRVRRCRRRSARRARGPGHLRQAHAIALTVIAARQIASWRVAEDLELATDRTRRLRYVVTSATTSPRRRRSFLARCPRRVTGPNNARCARDAPERSSCQSR